MKNETYTITRETQKALLLKNEEGKTFWIQKRWMRKDGTLTAAGLKSESNAQTVEEWKEEKEAAKWTSYSSTSRESEKAIQAVANVYCVTTDQSVNMKFWIPKSIIKDDQMPIWFADKKAEELISSHSYYGNGGSSLQVDFI